MKSIRTSVFVILLLMMASATTAQKSTLKGFIYDSNTGEPVMFANIWLPELVRGAVSNDQGFYILEDIPEGNVKARIFCIGYDTLFDQVSLEAGGVHIKDFYLHPASYELNEVLISSDNITREKSTHISDITILPEEIKMIPSTGSMPDLIQHIQTLPGVVSSGDVGGQIYIRGGAPVQNKVLLDGATIFNPIHSIGLFSVFDPDMITKADVFTGGFNAEYGGSISSIMDITSKYGNVYRHTGKAELSTLGTKLTLEGPLVKKDDKSLSNISYLLNARHCFYDEAIKLYYQYSGNETPFTFTDLYGKISFFTGTGFKANIFGFHFTDLAGNDDSPVHFGWTNKGIGGHILIMPSRSSTLIEGHFALSNYDMEMNEMPYLPRTSKVSNVNAGLAFINYFGDNHFRYGFDLLSLKTDYLFFTTEYNSTRQLEFNTEISGYMTLHIQKGNLLLDPGLRLQYYSSLTKMSPEPRLSAKYNFTETFRVKCALGLYSQNLISGTSDRDVVNFFNGYLSAPVNIKSRFEGKDMPDMLQKSQHIIAGFEKDFAGKVFVNAEFFYKNYPQLINYNRNKLYNDLDYPDKPDIETKDFVYEKGMVEGMDISARYFTKKMQFTLNYSLSYSWRYFEMPDGSLYKYHPHYDRRHNLNFLASVWFGKKDSWQASIRWHYGSGFPFTKSVGYFEDLQLDENALTNYLTQNGTLTFYYDDLNTGRLPYYQRVDASLKRTWQLRKNMDFEAEFNIINVFDEENIFYINRISGQAVYQLPFLPGLRAGLSF